MKMVGTYLKIHDPDIEDLRDTITKFSNEIMLENIATKIKFLKKGVKLTFRDMRHGYDNDDLMHNNITVVTRFTSVKIPRFLAKSLLRKLC